MSSAIVMFVMCLHHSSSCSQEHHLSDSPWIGLQVSAVVRGATRCDVPFTTSSSPPSKSSQGVTIQPQEVALGYSHGGAIEHENIVKQIFNSFNQQSNTVDTDPAVIQSTITIISQVVLSFSTKTLRYNTAKRYRRKL